MINRRRFIFALPALAVVRSLFAAAGAADARIGLCAFSCHQHWKAVNAKEKGVKFTDAPTFYKYARELGAHGVQTALRDCDPKSLCDIVQKDGGYFEADVRLPKTARDVEAFDAEVKLARAAGASVARTIFMGQRRYEFFKTRDEFDKFTAQARASLELAEPVVRKHRLRLAVENHKDHTAEELIVVLRKLSSEWVGALVDTGNNIALLDEPHAAIEALAPFALSIHFKDMAVQPHGQGFLLSEVRPGEGMLDLPRIIKALRAARPDIVFNLEMATRDPLLVPCRTDAYWTTFPDRRATHLDAAIKRVKDNPPKHPPPSVKEKPLARVLEEEEANNRAGLEWMRRHV